MLRTAKINKEITLWPTVFSGALLAAVLAVLPATTVAQCAKWDASGDWVLYQGPLNRAKPNDSSQLRLQQTNAVVTGTAKAAYVVGKRRGERYGDVDGTFVRGRFKIQIFWNTGEIGVYEGNVLQSGRLQGEAWEKKSPHIRYAWHSSTRMRCG